LQLNAVGDWQTKAVCERILQEELSMACDLDSHLPGFDAQISKPFECLLSHVKIRLRTPSCEQRSCRFIKSAHRETRLMQLFVVEGLNDLRL
jgi:hypothetical protein